MAQRLCAYSKDILTSPLEGKLLIKQKAPDTDLTVTPRRTSIFSKRILWSTRSLDVFSFNYCPTAALKRGAHWELDCGVDAAKTIMLKGGGEDRINVCLEDRYF